MKQNVQNYYNSNPYLTIHFNQSSLDKDYYCNILVWTMYNIYEIFYLITLYKPEAANTVWSS